MVKEFDDFKIISSGGKIMLSAPHAVPQIRDGHRKPAEPFTGKILEEACQSGLSGIVKTKCKDDDANFDMDSDYKSELVEYISSNSVKLLFDLHELNNSRPMEVCIGTGYGKNIFEREDILGIIREEFCNIGIDNITVDDPFAASREYTISAYVSQSCHIPAFQIEMNCSMFEGESNRAKSIASALVKMAERIEVLL